ncbi:hypothetical protein [Halalkalibacter okhensis]|uniref:Uncharacterized protein n=1 Tax=Halalkalibacter okhensis TaxID=333138 RepID=A0A0B0IA44_9BACI|nr:hypothetical protein [Halalkalibacter okhensis]KHF39383.1 hypothetical protein LQ50_15975 [Halalkalibacter okhensis]
MQTNFNLTGYHYVIEDEFAEPIMMLIEEGFINKERYEAQMTAGQALKVVMAINQANSLWMISIFQISVFLTGLFMLLSTPFRNRKSFKWYVGIYLLSLIVVVIWNITSHIEIIENIVRNLKSIER